MNKLRKPGSSVRSIRLTENQLRNFWAKVDKRGPNECWEWTGNKSGGYGALCISPKMVKAHRISWMLHFGDIPEGGGTHGICVLHKCDNPGCVNPQHLFLGTNADNARDRESKSRGSRTGVNYIKNHPEVHPRGEDNKRSKLTAEIVTEMRLRYAAGETTKALGAEFGVSQPAASYAINGKNWKHLPGAIRRKQSQQPCE